MGARRYVLDTNILVHWTRRDPLWARISRDYSLLMIEPTPVISTVTIGELLSLARQFGWGGSRRQQMDFALNYFPAVTIHQREVHDAYAKLDSYCNGEGRPMGKNDLWIAANTMALGATLLTSDRDFEIIAPHLIDWEWIDPTT